MIIVAGHLQVAPDDRQAYLAQCVPVVEQGRAADGCLDFALSLDAIVAGRINVLERWESSEALHAFRGSGPTGEQQTQILSADVHDYEIAGQV